MSPPLVPFIRDALPAAEDSLCVEIPDPPTHAGAGGPGIPGGWPPPEAQAVCPFSFRLLPLISGAPPPSPPLYGASCSLQGNLAAWVPPTLTPLTHSWALLAPSWAEPEERNGGVPALLLHGRFLAPKKTQAASANGRVGSGLKLSVKFM